MIWRSAAKAVDAINDNTARTIGVVTIENRIDNLRAAQTRVKRARDELESATYDFNVRAKELADALNDLDLGISTTAETLTSHEVLQAGDMT